MLGVFKKNLANKDFWNSGQDAYLPPVSKIDGQVSVWYKNDFVNQCKKARTPFGNVNYRTFEKVSWKLLRDEVTKKKDQIVLQNVSQKLAVLLISQLDITVEYIWVPLKAVNIILTQSTQVDSIIVFARTVLLETNLNQLNKCIVGSRVVMAVISMI